MQRGCGFGLIVIVLFLGGCVSSPTNMENLELDEQIDLYLSTLDDKHFVWCELDLVQCRKDFEKWRQTAKGLALIRQYESEESGRIVNTHQVPKLFRTRFVDDKQFSGELEGLTGESALEGMAAPSHPKVYGPDLPD